MLRRTLVPVVTLAAFALAPATPAVAQGATVVQCSQIFGTDVQGIILFTPGGTPSVFSCTGGIFNRPPTGFQLNIPCSDLFGDDVIGRIVFTQGGVSIFTCQGGPFG